MPIVQLPPLLVNQIAAGEVIERPASVVKELVENSLDAGANRVDVAVEDGGKQLIRISDDGHGIAEAELRLALAAHATSKLQSAEQLEAISTMGFRGEALASIASVSRLRLVSRAISDGVLAESGWAIEASGDQIAAPTPAACAPGTIIEVRDLFFNTPARRKFMKSAASEFGHISDLIQRIAMVWPHVGFTLMHNGRRTLELPAGQDRHARCVAILGKELQSELLEFEREEPPELGGFRLWGLAGTPAIARATSKFLYTCLNGRPIRDRHLMHAVKEAYRGLIAHDRQPVVVLMLGMDPAAVDVNVHPTKSEVRFREANRVHGIVLSTLKRRLLGGDLTPAVTFQSAGQADSAQGQSPPGHSPVGGRKLGDAAMRWQAGADAHAGGGGIAGGAASGASSGSASDFVNYFRSMDPYQKGFVYQQVKAALEEEAPGMLAASDTAPPAPAEASAATLHAQAAPGAAPESPGIATGQPVAPQPDGQAPVPMLPGGSVLQVHNSYLVTQDEQGILIVDQHALHERVMFEQLKARVLGRNLESQRLLMPVVLEMSPSRMALVEQLGPLLERIGIEAEPMGPSTLGIQGFPTFLFDRHVEPGSFLSELLDRIEDEQIEAGSATAEEAALHRVLDMMACKAAVKAGDRLHPQELASLLAQRETVERAASCPHGRPTTIRLSLRELEKQFKRT